MSRLQQIDELFHDALRLPPTERDAFLRQATPDPQLQDDVARMLATHTDAYAWFDQVGQSVRAAHLLPTEDSWQNAMLGPYRMLQEIGRGGMGTVYRAERSDGIYSQTVAVKVIRTGYESEHTYRRFLAERRILSRLRHDGIAQLYDGGETPTGAPYLVMEYVEGLPIHTFCRQHHLSARARLQLMLQVADAVSYAHASLVVHRDLKPGNILVTPGGRPKLLDFGIAKLLEPAESTDPALTQDHRFPLTPDYASPEQLRGEPITTRSDVWSLGALLFELLTESRFRNPETPPATAAIDPDLHAICDKALAEQADDRYASVEQFAADIDRFLQGLPITARRSTFVYRSAKFLHRNRWPVAVVSLFLLSSSTLSVALWLQSARLVQERDKAQRVSELFVDLFSLADPDEARLREIPAREVLDRGVERVRSSLESQPEVRASLFDVMARVYYKLGLYEKAAPLIEIALQAPATPAVRAARLHTLGLVQHDLGRYDAAIIPLRQALELRRSTRDPLVAQSCAFLALALFRKGDHKTAEPLFREALALHRARPTSKADLADALTGLALLSFATGKYLDAEQLLREALQNQRQAFGNQHRQIADTLNNLASVLSRLGRDKESEPLAREAITILRATRPRHPKLATAMNNLGLMLAIQGRETEAEPLLQESLRLRREILPPKHPDTAQSLSNLGWLLTTLTRFEEAEQLLSEALAIRQAVFGPDHILVSDALGNLGMLALERGDATRAQPRLDRALMISQARLGDSHPVVATHRNNLAALHAVQGRTDAVALFEQALALRRQLLPKQHPHLAYSLLGLGSLLVLSGDTAGAEPLLWEALEIRSRALPAGHRLVAEAGAALAACLRARGAVPEADTLLARHSGSLLPTVFTRRLLLSR